MKNFTTVTTDATLGTINLLAFYFFISIGLDPLVSTFLSISSMPFFTMMQKERRALIAETAVSTGEVFGIKSKTRAIVATIVMLFIQAIITTAVISLFAQLLYFFTGQMNPSYLASIVVFTAVGILFNYHVSCKLKKINGDLSASH